DSPELAQLVEEAFAANVPDTAWQVTMNEEGRLRWTGHDEGVPVSHDEEPDAGWWRRAAAAALSILPLDWLLSLRDRVLLPGATRPRPFPRTPAASAGRASAGGSSRAGSRRSAAPTPRTRGSSPPPARDAGRRGR